MMTDNGRSASYKRKLEVREKKRHKRISDAINRKFYHPFGYYPVDDRGKYTNEEEEITYYKRYRTTQLSKFLKRQSNKKIRHMDIDEALQGGDYKKVYDYWWILY